MIKGQPEAQLIVITCVDGSTALMQFVTKQQRTVLPGGNGQVDPGWTREASPENIDAEIRKSNIPFVGWRHASMSEVPNDRTFRNAWKDGSTKVDVDMPKARNIWRDKMREARVSKLSTLDAAYLRADEVGDAQLKRTIATQKQVLRDVTTLPAIEAAKTPEELKAVWPVELN
jgi:hypothetical protein